MILVTDFIYRKDRTPGQAVDAINTARQFAGIRPEGGVMAFNETFRVFGSRLDYGIAMKDVARKLHMRFIQPIIKMRAEKFDTYMRYQMGQRGYTNGNYLLLPDGWHLTGAVDVKAITGMLANDSCNYVALPTPEDEESPEVEQEPEFVSTPIISFEYPHFGKLEAFVAGERRKWFQWTNNGWCKPVCSKIA